MQTTLKNDEKDKKYWQINKFKESYFFIYAKLLRIKAVVLRTLIRNPAEI